MGAYTRLEKVAPESLEAGERAFLVALHHRGEADHVSGKDRGERRAVILERLRSSSVNLNRRRRIESSGQGGKVRRLGRFGSS